MALICPTCRATYDDGLTYCPADGSQLRHSEPEAPPVAAVAAAAAAPVYTESPAAPVAPTPPPTAAPLAAASPMSGALIGGLVGLVVVLGGILAVTLMGRDTPGPVAGGGSQAIVSAGGGTDEGVGATAVEASDDPAQRATTPLPDRRVTVQTPAPSAPMSGPAEVVSNNEGLFLRSGPGTGYAVLGKMLPGDIVTAYECDTVADGVRWCNVLYGGVSGYASREFLDVGGPSADRETGLEQAFAASEVIGAYASIDASEVSFVNLRLRPFTGSTVVAKMRPGASIEVVRCLPYGWSLGGSAIQGRWCFVNWSGTRGAASGWASDGAILW